MLVKVFNYRNWEVRTDKLFINEIGVNFVDDQGTHYLIQSFSDINVTAIYNIDEDTEEVVERIEIEALHVGGV